MKHLDKDKFLQIARAIPDDSRVPYAFEKRILAALPAAPRSLPDLSSAWARLLWKAAAVSLAITLGTGVLASFVEDAQPLPILSTELEEALLAPITLDEEVW